jgi:hypothetical protein
MNGNPEIDLDRFRRWLGIQLHRRFYHDIGAEVDPGTWRVTTPYCLQGEHVLGTLADIDQLPTGPWHEATVAAFAKLGTGDWLRTRHLGCFHRRSRACYDLVYEVAARLLAADPALSVTRVHRAAVAGGDEIDGPADQPPRVLRIARDDQCVAVLHSSGQVAISARTVDLRASWRAGGELKYLADDIAEQLRKPVA